MSDKEFLEWLHARIVNLYGENPNADFMNRFQLIIDWMDPAAQNVIYSHGKSAARSNLYK